MAAPVFPPQSIQMNPALFLFNEMENDDNLLDVFANDVAQHLVSQFEVENPDPAPTRSSHSAGIFNGAYDALFYAASGFLGGYFFSLIDPIGGAVFGTASLIAETVTNTLISRSGLNSCLRTLLWAGAFFANIAAGAFIASSLGFPITLTTACILTFAMIPASLVAKPLLNMALFGAKCAAACIGGGLLAIKDRLV